MSAADVAVKAYPLLEYEDFKILLAIESGMSKYAFIPVEFIEKTSNLPPKRVAYRLSKLHSLGLIRRWSGSYTGYTLKTAGLDCLAIDALVKANLLEAFGKSLGVGKEADVYDALTPEGKRVAVKFHRLGRSFKQSKKLRSYASEYTTSWFQQSIKAAKREYKALKLVYPVGVAVPEPLGRNRHVIVMGMIEGEELYKFTWLPNPKKTLKEILDNIRISYLKAGVIHGDLSEFNVIVKPNWKILIIDWPQYVDSFHPNAKFLLERDIKNILKFFERKFKLTLELNEVLSYVVGETEYIKL